MAVWSVLAAPLLMSVDLATIRPEFKEVLLNEDIIAVDQDPLGKQGMRVWTGSGFENNLTTPYRSGVNKCLDDLQIIVPGLNLCPCVSRFHNKEENPTVRIWNRELADGSYAIAFVNLREDGAPVTLQTSFEKMKIPKQIYKVKDLYNDEKTTFCDLKGKFETRINPTGVRFYKFTPLCL